MAKQSPLEDILDSVRALCFHLPFWGVPIIASICAGATYWSVNWVLGKLPGLEVAAANRFAFYAAAFVLALSFLAGLAGWFDRKRSKKLLAETNTLEQLRALSWLEFEHLVAESYRNVGYKVKETKVGPDGGIDVDTMSPTGQRVIIQCKHWKTTKNVGVAIVREMLGVMVKEQADKVIVIITGQFTKEAINWAQGQPIELINGPQLIQVLQQTKHTPPTKTSEPAATAVAATVSQPAIKVSAPVAVKAATSQAAQKSCPQCGSELVMRTAKRGANAGNTFLGCLSFPKCRHVEAAE